MPRWKPKRGKAISDACSGASDAANPKMSDLLSVVACGSVVDGKSTLIGRLLYDSGALSEDQFLEIGVDGAGPPDFSLALDGLAAEREQGITIDVAYRSFSSPHRRFLVADVPGHEQYTRNMVTGASTADAALLVVDVSKGILSQTRRHTYLAWLLGIRHFILAANKMDLVAFREEMFGRVAAEFKGFLAQFGLAECDAIPVSAPFGDNVVERSARTDWYRGPTLAEALHDLRTRNDGEAGPFRLPVQWVNRSGKSRRGYSGMIAAGCVEVGQHIQVEPSGQVAGISEIVTFDGHLERAVYGQSVTVILDKQIDVGRGNVICAIETPARCADSLDAIVIWLGESPLVRGRSYRLKIGTNTVFAQVAGIKHKVDIDTLQLVSADALTMNEIGYCHLALDEAVAFDIYEQNRQTGGFILIDRISNDTVGAGLVQTGALKHGDVPWQSIEVSKTSRCVLKKHPPAVLWFTGISGAGKSTIANLVEKMLHAEGRHTYLLDGDNIRHGLNRDLGFSDADRIENVRRVAEVAKLMADAGLIVLVALISPFRAERRAARQMIGKEEFIEVFVDTPLEIAEARDAKGLYGKARRGEIHEFTGIDSGYEVPERPELHIDTTRTAAESAAKSVVDFLENVWIAGGS
jgi:bifunctional enzyme CysN/CysC